MVGRQSRRKLKTLISCPAAALHFLSGRSFIHGEVGSLQRESKSRDKAHYSDCV